MVGEETSRTDETSYDMIYFDSYTCFVENTGIRYQWYLAPCGLRIVHIFLQSYSLWMQHIFQCHGHVIISKSRSHVASNLLGGRWRPTSVTGTKNAHLRRIQPAPWTFFAVRPYDTFRPYRDVPASKSLGLHPCPGEQVVCLGNF